MKPFLALLACIFLSAAANARCASRGITIYPQRHYLPPNGQIVLELFAQSADMIPELGKAHPIYLQESLGKRVPLKVVRTFIGGFRLTQVVLTPAMPLLPGHSYELKIGNLPKGEILHGAYEEGKGTYDKAFWTVKSVARPDGIAPLWEKVPAYTSTDYTEFGCGPARYVRFTAAVSDGNDANDEVMLLTTVRALGSGKTTHFLLPAHWSGAMAVGHGMCSGGFSFDDDGEYEVVFTPVDFAGNTGSPSAPLRFLKPAPSANKQ